MSDTPMHYQSIAELSRRIRSGGLSPVQLTETLLERIEKLNPKLHAFMSVNPERALNEARSAEAALMGGQDLGPLHGIPYAVKDLYDVRGEATTGGTRLLEDNIAEEDCLAVRKLSQAGMILLGKTHTVQFAFGGVGINHDQGTPHNPWHADPHAPGGSSSGSAVAVASGMVPVALGTDTGGSVRIPAALNGLAGLKTTIGRISRAGVYSLSWTLDSVGPLARTVEDCAFAYNAMQGVDFNDETTVGIAPHDPLKALKEGVAGLRIAFCDTLFFDEVDPEVEQAVRASAEVFESLGATVKRIAVPEVMECFTFGRRALMVAAEGCAVNGRLLDDHFDQLDPVVAQRMIAGRELPAVEYFQLVRKWDQLQRSVKETLRDVDILLAPTCQVPPLPITTIDSDFETYSIYNVKYLRNTTVGNMLNLSAATVTCGFSSGGLPIGLMLYAKPFEEDVTLRAAHAYEQAAGFVARHPDLSWAGE